MKISSVQAFPVQDGGRALLVRVSTDEGLEGWGEIGLLYHAPAAIAATSHLGRLIAGRDALATEDLWQTMYRSGAYPSEGVYASALSAIDIALWDLKGRALGVPVYRLLGGPTRDRVAGYAHVESSSDEGIVENARRAVDAGWEYLRWSHGGIVDGVEALDAEVVVDPARAVEQVVAQFSLLRDAVGPTVELCYDVHTRLELADSVRLCRAVEPFRPFFIEDPLRSEEPALYRALARQVSVPLAAGEHWSSPYRFRTVIEENLVEFVRPDLCICGGITGALKLAHWAEMYGVRVVPHNPLGAVSTAACVQFCLAVPNAPLVELHFTPGTVYTAVAPVQVGFERGHCLAPESPGLGVELDFAKVQELEWEPGAWPPRYRTRDGGYVNW